jgi:hypothetical protein
VKGILPFLRGTPLEWQKNWEGFTRRKEGYAGKLVANYKKKL